MFTASHNPARYNGLKLCQAGARPIGRDTGLTEIQATAEELLEAWGADGPPDPDPTGLDDHDAAVDQKPHPAAASGSSRSRTASAA